MGLEIVRPESVHQAASLIAGDPGARLVGGGTLLVRAVNSGNTAIEKLVLSDRLGLDRITVEGGRVTVGAAVTMTKVAAHSSLGFLRPVAHSIGGPAVRAMATIGGNLHARYPYGDFAAALLALDAEVTAECAADVETVPLGTFLSARNSGRVVKNVAFNLPPEGAFRFIKAVRKHPHGASVLSIAAMLPTTGGVLAGVRVAYCAMAPTPMRAHVVERALDGMPLDENTIETAVAAAAEGCAPLSDPQASDWYRLNVLPVYLKRLLQSFGG
jgi:CO/xanthine dehydrogenase FAD-binding subunit